MDPGSAKPQDGLCSREDRVLHVLYAVCEEDSVPSSSVTDTLGPASIHLDNLFDHFWPVRGSR